LNQLQNYKFTTTEKLKNGQFVLHHKQLLQY